MLEKNPFTGRQEKRLTYQPKTAAPAAYIPFEPPFPFVDLRSVEHDTGELIDLYARIMAWPESELPTSLEEVGARFGSIFTTALTRGAEWSETVFAIDRSFRDRLSSMTTTTANPPDALVDSLAELAVQAKARDEDLWLICGA